MRWSWSKLSFVTAWALVILSLAPLAWLFGCRYFCNSDTVAMPIPLRQDTSSSAWFITDTSDLYELDLRTIPWRHDPIDFEWQIVDFNGNMLASGSTHDQDSGTQSVMLTRYIPKPGLRQRILVSVPHSVVTAEAAPTILLYRPEAALGFADSVPVAILWAVVLLTVAAVFFFISFLPRVLE